MKNHNINSRGFGTTGIIILLLVVSTVSGISLVVYKKSANKAATPATVSAKTNTSSPKPAIDNKNQEHYLQIAKLGIKIKLSNETKDLVADVADTHAGFSLQSFLDTTANMDTVKDMDGKTGCRSLVSVSLFKPEQREQLQNDPIQSYTFDAEGAPTDSKAQFIVQLSDKRYAVFHSAQSTCIRNGNDTEAALTTETQIRNRLLQELPANTSSDTSD